MRFIYDSSHDFVVKREPIISIKNISDGNEEIIVITCYKSDHISHSHVIKPS